MARLTYDLPLELTKVVVFPEDLTDEILKEMAQRIKPAIEREARERLGDGITAKSFTIKKAKTNTQGVRYKDVAPTGTRPNGRKEKRKAEVAFLNEYGVPSKGMSARKFMEAAVEAEEDALKEIAQKAINKYIDKIF